MALMREQLRARLASSKTSVPEKNEGSMAKKFDRMTLMRAQLRARLASSKTSVPKQKEGLMAQKFDRMTLMRAQLRARLASGKMSFPKAPGQSKASPKAPRQRDEVMQDNMVEQDQGVHHTEDRVFSQVSGSPVLPGYKRMRTEEDESSSGPTTAFFLSDSRERQRRVVRSMNVLCRDADEDYLDSMDPTQEVNEMHQAWAEFSIRATSMMRRYRYFRELQDKVDELEASAKKHVPEVATVNAKITRLEGMYNLADSQAKADVKRIASLKNRNNGKKKIAALAIKVAKLKEELERAKESASASRQTHVDEWQKSEDGVTYLADVAQRSMDIGEKTTHDRMREALKRCFPEVDYNIVWDECEAIRLAEVDALAQEIYDLEHFRLY
ncbi:hypothetical protein SOVF_106130 [Spinacia oleracea]|nr:hypothetical protein SOVF_106130 [Spinacia oleracea]